ncbi:hypothetical protein CEP52_004443 [Fusarium oligoseptatum]|uniref:beta-N-acetylhexosaminidase n=1 Tax=Fusarium oligoseptatum TaxID=2604345 RepID=A0A428U3E9_9HYPO|nr:hypothetical protein CEP52_004443 [Fusarium oligoseptatum]
MRLSFLSLSTLVVLSAASILPGIPTANFTPQKHVKAVEFSSFTSIIVDSKYANVRDSKGQTLIPPSLAEFAETFADDLSSLGFELSTRVGSKPRPGTIFLTLGRTKDYLDVAGRETPEGYSIDVNKSITVKGASPLGVWWGTRTILQQILLTDGNLLAGSIHDSPGWGSRGMMLDAARQYYPPNFIVELCSYMSFFKQNTLHLHLSDNLWNNPDLFDFEEQMRLYATFRLYSDDQRVKGLNKRPEESYTRQVFDDIQSKCAARGVTILPEIEAPGHALVFSQWKPQIGMSSDYTLLNITHPETIPAVKMVWKVFLPWFHSKTVSIGADEYRDSSLDENALTAEYERFVNELNDFIAQESGKKVRIWGTFPPSSGSDVDKSVSIQHWANFEAHAITDWLANDYNVLNSGDDLYVVSKWSAGYPQVLNQTFIFHGSPDGSAFAPNIFDPLNETENTARDDPRIEGHIAPLWTDWGPNSTTILETYYSWRDGLPALADKQWGGKLTEEEYPSLFEALQPFVPDQNLDRRIPNKGLTILEYDFAHDSRQGIFKDKSGNGYDAKSSCKRSKRGVHLSPSCKVTTPLSSKGRDYTFSFSINPTSANTGPIFTGSDSSLWAGYESTTNVTLVADDSAYTLNYTFPLNKWTNAKLIGKGPRTFLAVDNQEPMEFLTKIGIRGRRYVWDKIAVEAPLNVIGGGDFEGILGYFKLEDEA